MSEVQEVQGEGKGEVGWGGAKGTEDQVGGSEEVEREVGGVKEAKAEGREGVDLEGMVKEGDQVGDKEGARA